MNCNEKNFGPRLRSIRKERGMNQGNLADLSGIGRSSICEFEKGRKIPGICILSKLCNALQVSPNRLLLDLD